MGEITQQKTQTIESVEHKATAKGSDPFSHVGSWDFVIVFLAILLRFVIVAKRKIRSLEAKSKEFDINQYFDFKHIVRWIAHTCTALIGILVFPEIFVHYIQPRYFDGLDIWTLFGSGVIGYAGYDVIRVIEKLSLSVMEKFGLRLNE